MFIQQVAESFVTAEATVHHLQCDVHDFTVFQNEQSEDSPVRRQKIYF